MGILLRASFFFFFSSRRRHTRLVSDWSSDVCSSDLLAIALKFLRHTVEGVDQRAKFVSGRNLYTMPQVAATDLLCRLSQGRDRTGHQSRHIDAKPSGG